jgi:molybdopterin molybdotransferase
MLSYSDARQTVIDVARAHCGALQQEAVELSQALGRVLAQNIAADRDYPPFHRSTRDGFAVRASDISSGTKTLKIIGESRAGVAFPGSVGLGECVQIMTGAAVPAGADAVVMQEHTRIGLGEVAVDRELHTGENIVPAASEAKSGGVVVPRGARLGFAELGMAAQVGATQLEVFRRPRVAILSTGDEVVPVEQKPGPVEIRNSNSVSLAAQAKLAGAEPVPLGNAPDKQAELRALIERGLQEDILVLSGGVSVGKYDFVEAVLRELGAEFFFDAISIRPGKPAVFGKCRGKLVFGLPGNPVSTMVTFELLAVPAIDICSGLEPRALPLLKARLAKPVEQKAGLTHLLPALVHWEDGEPIVEELAWRGSGDVAAIVKANCFLVLPAETKHKFAAGDWVSVLPRRDMI